MKQISMIKDTGIEYRPYLKRSGTTHRFIYNKKVTFKTYFEVLQTMFLFNKGKLKKVTIKMENIKE